MNEKDMFDLLYDALKDVMRNFITNTMQTLAFLIIIIGWIITNEDARNYVALNGFVKMLALPVVVLIGVLHAMTSRYFYQRSQSIKKDMDKLSLIKVITVHLNYEITRYVLGITLVTNLAMFVVLFGIIATISDVTPSSSRSAEATAELTVTAEATTTP